MSARESKEAAKKESANIRGCRLGAVVYGEEILQEANGAEREAAPSVSEVRARYWRFRCGKEFRDHIRRRKQVGAVRSLWRDGEIA